MPWRAFLFLHLDRRHQPLIVDSGSRPTDWQEAVFNQCTHAILLWRDVESHQIWHTLLTEHGLSLLAELRSDLQGDNVIADAGPVLRGTLAGLERGHVASGPVLEALVERVAALFNYTPTVLRAIHQSSAPVELVIELSRLGRTLDALDGKQEWLPQHLPRVLDYLPAARPLGLYDRGPNWLYAALALYAQPEPLYQFDVRLGWVRPPHLRVGQPAQDAPLQAALQTRSDHVRIEFLLREAYLDYAEADGLVVPPTPAEAGVVLSGKLPLWLWTAVALAYQSAPWLAVYQPQLHDRAVIVKSEWTSRPVGQLIRSAATL